MYIATESRDTDVENVTDISDDPGARVNSISLHHSYHVLTQLQCTAIELTSPIHQSLSFRYVYGRNLNDSFRSKFCSYNQY